MDAAPALAEMVEAGASLGGGDRPSVIAACIAALEIAGESEGLPFDAAAEVHLRFKASGEVVVAVMDGSATEHAVTVSADAMAALFEMASQERDSIPPPDAGD